jgi:hypothetical protein
VAFGATFRALPVSAKVLAALEGDDCLPLARDATWVQRGDLVPSLDLPAEPGVAYVAVGKPEQPRALFLEDPRG